MSYNGWSNYETWAVALWWDNDHGAYLERVEQGRQCIQDAADMDGDKDDATRALADWLKDTTQDNAPDLGASLYADLLGAALSEVDWYEIASNWLDDEEWPEPEPEDETTAATDA